MWHSIIENHPIEVIGSYTFTGLTSLEELWLRSNLLATIPSTALGVLGNLRELYAIENIENYHMLNNSFDLLKNYRSHLAFNQIGDFNQNVFHGLNNVHSM